MSRWTIIYFPVKFTTKLMVISVFDSCSFCSNFFWFCFFDLYYMYIHVLTALFKFVLAIFIIFYITVHVYNDS